DWIGRDQFPEAAGIRPQGGSHDLGVAAVVFGSGQDEAVAEAVELLGVDRIDIELTLHQRLDHWTVRHLDGDVDLAGTGRFAALHQPRRHLGEAFAAMSEHSLADAAAVTICQADMMALTGPIHAGIPSLLGHAPSPAS